MKRILKIRIILLALLVTSLISCATTGEIPLPANKNATLIVIPRLLIDVDTRLNTSTNYLVLTITLENIDTSKERVFVIRSLTDDYIMLSNVPPGKYIIKKLQIGSKTYTGSLTRYIEVLSGHMTIFPYQLQLCFYENKTFFDFLEIKKKEMEKMIAFLSKYPNFKLWQKPDL